MAGQGDMSISATEVSHFLKGADFPLSKQDLISHAEDNDAPEELINFLDSLPDKQYQSMADIEHEVGQKK